MTETLLTVATRTQDGVPIIMASGELDASTAPSLREVLDAIDDSCPKLVVDLANVSFLDSTALGVLVQVSTRLTTASPAGNVVLVITHPHVLRVLEVTGLDKVFTITQRVSDAVELP